GWTPCGIVQRTARTPARRQNGPPTGDSPRHERCNRYRKRVLFEVPLRKTAIEQDLYDDRHAAGLDLMRRIYEHFLKEGMSRPAFPIYAYTSKGPFLLAQKDWRNISTGGPRSF